MDKKRLFLIAGILSLLIFFIYLGETESLDFRGITIMNIWVIRLLWLIAAIANFVNYFNIKKMELAKE